MMKKTMLIIASGLLLVACSPKGGSEKDPGKTTQTTGGQEDPPKNNTDMSVTQPKDNPQTEDPADDRGNELHPYFPQSERDIYTCCHSEKGTYDDYWDGKIIPALMVDKYELYKFNISPTVALQFKKDDPGVVVKGIERLSYEGRTIYIYCVGINVDAEEQQPSEGVDYRALVMNDKHEEVGNYFIGGYVRQEGRDEAAVCRQLGFAGDQIKLTFMREGSVNPPSHLRIQPETMLGL